MPHGHTEPRDPDYTRHNAVRNLAARRVVGEFEAQPALNDGERQEKTAPPHVKGRPDGSPLFPNIDSVVKGSKRGLENEGGDDGETDDGVVFRDLCHGFSGPADTFPEMSQ